MPRRLSAAVSPVLSLVEWVFSAAAPGIDLLLGCVAAWWLAMMTLRPQLFDRGSFVGMQWAPDVAWIVFVACVVAMHAAGLFNTGATRLRQTACLASAWYWICVSISLSRDGLVPGTGTYGIVGLTALASAIYVSGRPTRSA